MDSVVDFSAPLVSDPVPSFDLGGLDAVSEPQAQADALTAQYDGADAQTLLRLALSLYRGRIALVSSFGAESAVLLHMVAQIDRATPVIFLDTGRLFAQTMLYRNELARLLGLTDIRTAKPDPKRVAQEDPARLLAHSDPDLCCSSGSVRLPLWQSQPERGARALWRAARALCGVS